MPPLIKSFEQLGREMIHPNFRNADAIAMLGWNELSKAMSVYGITGYGDLTALRLEDLDATMTSVLYKAEHLKLFNSIPRVPAIQVYHQFNRRLSYGSSRQPPGFREGSGPQGQNSQYERSGAYVRFMGTKRGITHQSLMVGQAGGLQLDPVTEENTNGTLDLLAQIERWLIWGDGTILDAAGNTVNYDGLLKQLTTQEPANVIDWAGDPPTFDLFDMLALRLADGAKLPSFANLKCFMHGEVLTDLSRQKYQYERVLRGGPEAPAAGYWGEPLKGHATNFGTIPFDWSTFLDAVEGGTPFTGTIPESAPAEPGSLTGLAGTGGSPGLPEGTYYFKASAVNAYGESTAVASAGVAVASPNNKVTLTIARTTGATFYRVYRSVDNTSTGIFKYIGLVIQPGAGDASFVDANSIRPGHGLIVLYNAEPPDIAIAQLAPLLKYPLPPVETTIPWYLLLYHVLALKAGKRAIIVKNVGRWTPS